MSKYVVFSSNDNLKYLYYKPLTQWCWNYFGWETIMFYHRSGERNERLINIEQLTEDACTSKVHNNQVRLIHVNGYKSETLAQVSRLYSASVVGDENDIIMTSDVDMLPLSNYWNPSDLNITCYGRDLTDYHYPICYCAMTPLNWIKVMLITDRDYNVCIKQDLEERDKNSNSWLWDQDILTERLNRYGKKLLTLMPRGTDKRTGYPIGRVDRSNWHLNHSQLIDAHLPHDILTNDESYKKVCDLLKYVWPNEDFTWYHNYHNEFKKLL